MLLRSRQRARVLLFTRDARARAPLTRYNIIIDIFAAMPLVIYAPCYAMLLLAFLLMLLLLLLRVVHADYAIIFILFAAAAFDIKMPRHYLRLDIAAYGFSYAAAP